MSDCKWPLTLFCGRREMSGNQPWLQILNVKLYQSTNFQKFSNYLTISQNISSAWKNLSLPLFFKLQSLNLPAVFECTKWMWENWCLLQWLYLNVTLWCETSLKSTLTCHCAASLTCGVAYKPDMFQAQVLYSDVLDALTVGLYFTVPV